MKMKLTEPNVTTIHAELSAAHERVYKLIIVKEIGAFHKLEQMRHLRLLEKLAAWTRDDGSDRNKIIAEMHRRTPRRLYPGDEPEHF